MDRVNEHALYSNISISQTGGGKSKSKSPKKNNTYIPADIDGEASTSLAKFRKANRLLQKELEQVKELLKKEQQKTSKLEKQLDIRKSSLF